MLVAGEEARPDGFRQVVESLVEFFYTNNRIFALPRPDWIQAALDVITVLFDSVGLQTNVKQKLGWCVSPSTLLADTRRRRICSV